MASDSYHQWRMWLMQSYGGYQPPSALPVEDQQHYSLRGKYHSTLPVQGYHRQAGLKPFHREPAPPIELAPYPVHAFQTAGNFRPRPHDHDFILHPP